MDSIFDAHVFFHTLFIFENIDDFVAVKALHKQNDLQSPRLYGVPQAAESGSGPEVLIFVEVC